MSLRIGGLCCCIVSCCLAGWSASVLSAQAQDPAQPRYEQLPTDARSNNLRTIFQLPQFRDVQSMLDGRSPLIENQFDSFFNDVLFPAFTVISKENIESLPLNRRNFKQRLARPATPQMLERLNRVTLAKMTQIAAGNFYPNVRINAMLMIGELNESEQPQKPYPAAALVLAKALAGENTPVPVRAAAIDGLIRHAQAKTIDAATQAQLIATSQTLAQTKTATDASPVAAREQEWLRRRAVDLLAALGDPGQQGSVVQILQAIVADPAASLELRSSAATALGSLKLEQVDTMKLAGDVARVAVDAYKAELQQARQTDQPIVKQRLARHVSSVRRALTAMTPAAADDPQKEFLANLQTQLDQLMRATTEAQFIEEPLHDQQVRLHQLNQVDAAGGQLEMLVAGGRAPGGTDSAGPGGVDLNALDFGGAFGPAGGGGAFPLPRGGYDDN